MSRLSSGSERARESSLGLDQIFGVLKNQRRRHVLEYLTTTDDSVRLGTLAEQIAGWENDKDVARITSQERKRVYVGLYQCHLPKMDDMDVISFNKSRGIVDHGEHYELVKEYLPADDQIYDDSDHLGWGDIWPLSLLMLALVPSLGILEWLVSGQVLDPITIVLSSTMLLIAALYTAR
ncbi:hypothetical protein Huta_0470 [Halorhabdus utahensis DSM 12940]|uniref:DUF7344 domain-containing protein n=1 Tax=Halorhabdus utahensis (strain DSM 12940 / JCM 11049 / AX-2) TaxID=519442 RepID=C7NS50_HALUD|nr:hypothetical protein [Halorhabdus utahensis]ACV10657.1 hypothetical protein Huta_0470 [Halorhabdus utahensis DSM 12940]